MELTGAAIVPVPASLDAASVAELSAAIARASTEPRTRAVLLRGAQPRVFCRGLDLAAVADGPELATAIETFGAALLAIRRCPKPVISLVDGEAAGGGVGVAAAADVVIATPEASFALPELLFGLTPAIVLPYLAERIRPQKLRWLALASERIDARTAADLGLVDRVEATPAADATIAAWITRLRRLNPEATAAWKRMTAAPPPIGSSDGIEITLGHLRSAEISGRLLRFAERGDPPWAMEEA